MIKVGLARGRHCHIGFTERISDVCDFGTFVILKLQSEQSYEKKLFLRLYHVVVAAAEIDITEMHISSSQKRENITIYYLIICESILLTYC